MSIKNLLPGKIGLGGAPLGNMFRAIPEDEAHATVSEAWNLGVRYFDTAPLYGSGLSEIRMGEALSQYPRDEYVLSSKVGRIMLDCPIEMAYLAGVARRRQAVLLQVRPGVDVLPTVLELAGIDAPDHVGYVPQSRIDGSSFAAMHSFKVCSIRS